MERILMIIIIIMMVLSGFAGVTSLIDRRNNAISSAVDKYIEHCTSPVQYELIDGVYRYQCDTADFISSFSPEELKRLKENK
ncbi:hypothetical protein AB7179_18490 [Providencia manganoxydans]|uniref:hypothetical protein n=1 Tax=Providencia TaxID=586 RepID=UPI00234BA85A|nr:hypothetical protein [Providencia sp. PROV117]